MTTAVAQDRLLEALAALDGTAGCLDGLLWSLPLAVGLAVEADEPLLAVVWERFADLVAAVRDDVRGEADA
jgi:hypothetical protein